MPVVFSVVVKLYLHLSTLSSSFLLRLGRNWVEVMFCYSEEKAKLLRRIGGMVEEKDQALETFMASLQLEHLNINSQQPGIPQVHYQYFHLSLWRFQASDIWDYIYTPTPVIDTGKTWKGKTIKNMFKKRKESDTWSFHSVGWKLLINPLSSWSVCSSDVYRHEAGRCRSLSFILIYFLSFYLSRFSFYINTHVYS